MNRMGDTAVSDFDRIGEDYDAILADTVGFGGEPRYFHRRKAEAVVGVLGSHFRGSILDFGCGVGGVLRELVDALPRARVFGYEPSRKSVAVAEKVPGAALVTDRWEWLPLGAFDAVLVSNVLHHIQPADRPSTVARIHGALRRGGRLMVMEHNPFNPVTRRVVATCPFDEGVVLLRPGHVRGLLSGSGFGDVRLRYTTFFPQFLERLSRLERWLGWCPAGAQTFTVGTKR